MVPVSEAYCFMTFEGDGPSRKKTSMTPLSDIQCVPTCARSPSPITKSTSFENAPCSISKAY